MRPDHRYERVLSFHLNRRGIAFCLFDAPGSLHDWGIKHVAWRSRQESTLAIARHLMERFAPDAVVIEDASAIGARRSKRVVALYREIEALADEHSINIYLYPWEAVFVAFAARHPKSRHDIAVQVANLLPMIKRRLPPKRRCWLPQDPRQSLFDAAALGLTYYLAHSRED
jgi:hypothetical protein